VQLEDEGHFLAHFENTLLLWGKYRLGWNAYFTLA
jgi:hypothetical protein